MQQPQAVNLLFDLLGEVKAQRDAAVTEVLAGERRIKELEAELAEAKKPKRRAKATTQS